MSDEEQREKNAKKFLTEQSQRAIALRSKDRDFHGLEREFLYYQAQMLLDYEKSKDIKHPRDLGDAREEILRKFLISSGYLPKRYEVSQRSARVASTTGNLSNEIDILLYDPLDSVSLMQREGVFEVFPVESVYGVIQVKSRLNKKEIKEGLENLASFKRLDRKHAAQSGFFISVGAPKSERGFGLLFAYDSDLEWLDIIHEIEAFANANPNRVWCNGIFILNKGYVWHGQEHVSWSGNNDIEKIQKLQMHGFPDRQNLCLYQFHNVLLHLLRTTSIYPVELDSYYRLPLIADAYSYEFCLGAFAEFATCEKHGDYQRKIAPDQLAKVIDWCSKATPINWIQAMDIAYGKPGANSEAYARQPGDVRIYNPEKLPLSDILVRDVAMGENTVLSALAFDSIKCAGMTIYIPYYYSAKELIVTICPKCMAAFTRAKQKKAKQGPQ